MKRIAVISLLPLILFNTMGYYLVFCADVLAAKHEAEVMIWGHQGLQEQVVSLKFRLSDQKPIASGLVFTDEDEFIYQGRMYDVISSTVSDGYIFYKCYTDNKETVLTQNLCMKINTDNETPGQRNKNNTSLKEFTKDYTPYTKDILTMNPILAMMYTIHDRVRSPNTRCESIVSPPPEIIQA